MASNQYLAKIKTHVCFVFKRVLTEHTTVLFIVIVKYGNICTKDVIRFNYVLMYHDQNKSNHNGIIEHILRFAKLFNAHVYLLETNAYINIVISYHITPMFVRKGLVFQLTVKLDTSLFLVISFLTCYKIFMSDYIIFYHPL